MKLHRKRVLLFILLIFIIINTTIPVVAADGDMDGGLPDTKELFKSGRLSKHISYFRNNYELDMEDFSIFRHPEGILNNFANTLFQAQQGLTYLLIIIFYYSFELNFFEIFSEFIETTVQELQTAIFDELALVAIGLLGLYYIIHIWSNNRTRIWLVIIQVVVILAFSYAFFNSPGEIFTGIDNMSKDISKKVLTGTYKSTEMGEPESAVTAAANEMWEMFVHKPWQVLEFGNSSMASKYEKKILELPPGSEAREDLVEKLAEDEGLFTTSWGGKRLGFMILYIIPMIIQFAVMFILCLLMLGYQALLIILAIIGVFVLLLSLIPNFGLRILANWGSKIVSCAATKVAITFVLAILVAFNSIIFELADVYGWLLVLIFQIVIIAMLVFKKNMLLEIFSIIRVAPQGGDYRLRKDYNIERKMQDFKVGNAANRINLRKRSKHNETDEGYSETSEGRRTSYSYRRQQSFDSDSYSEENRNINNSGMSRDKQGYENNGGYNSSQPYDYSKLMRKAEQVLEKQYQAAKKMAEKEAQQSGREAKYPYFVNQVDTREALGAPRFDDREIAYTMEKIKETINAGGNVEDLYKEERHEERDKEYEGPSSVIEVQIDGQKLNFERQEAEKVIIDDAALGMTNDFNQTYDRSYDKEFMKNLIKKYGKEQVKMVLDKMKDIQKKEGNIKNPAGYLNVSLKNNQKYNIKKSKAHKMRGNDNE